MDARGNHRYRNRRAAHRQHRRPEPGPRRRGQDRPDSSHCLSAPGTSGRRRRIPASNVRVRRRYEGRALPLWLTLDLHGTCWQPRNQPRRCGRVPRGRRFDRGGAAQWNKDRRATSGSCRRTRRLGMTFGRLWARGAMRPAASASGSKFGTRTGVPFLWRNAPPASASRQDAQTQPPPRPAALSPMSTASRRAGVPWSPVLHMCVCFTPAFRGPAGMRTEPTTPSGP